MKTCSWKFCHYWMSTKRYTSLWKTNFTIFFKWPLNCFKFLETKKSLRSLPHAITLIVKNHYGYDSCDYKSIRLKEPRYNVNSDYLNLVDIMPVIREINVVIHYEQICSIVNFHLNKVCNIIPWHGLYNCRMMRYLEKMWIIINTTA